MTPERENQREGETASSTEKNLEKEEGETSPYEEFFFKPQKKNQRRFPLLAIIPQQRLFGWQEIDELGDLERLVLVLHNLPDEELMRKLEQERGKGRDDYPVRAVWNSILAGIVFQHPSIESLRRELSRNAQVSGRFAVSIRVGNGRFRSSACLLPFLEKAYTVRRRSGKNVCAAGGRSKHAAAGFWAGFGFRQQSHNEPSSG